MNVLKKSEPQVFLQKLEDTIKQMDTHYLSAWFSVAAILLVVFIFGAIPAGIARGIQHLHSGKASGEQALKNKTPTSKTLS